jgi:hypothetical protein
VSRKKFVVGSRRFQPHGLRIQQFRVLGFFGCYTVFLAEITNGSAKDLERELGVDSANGFLSSLVAKDPGQSPVAIAAIFFILK